MAKLHNVAGALFEKEKINGDEFVQLFHMDETTSDETEETKTIEPDSDFEPENA